MATLEDMGEGMDLTAGLMKKIKGAATLNANAKMARHMHERTIENLGRKLEMSKMSGISNRFAARRGRYAAGQASIGNIAENKTRLKSISSNLNALNSQVV